VARRKAAARGKISIDKPFHKLMPGLGPHDAVELLNTAVRRKLAGLWCNGKEVDPGFFGTHLVLRARLMATRRWTAEIEATRALDEPVEAYTWQMDAEEIEALPTQPDTGGEAMQRATAAAEAARPEAATARAELEQARTEMQAAVERTERAEARVNAAEARVEAMSSTATDNTPQRKPGPKPTDDWPKELAAELIRIAVADPKALQNADKLVEEIQTDFADTGRFLPQDPKRVRSEIVLLLKHIR
jgi:chromosome segregation ATPase